MMNLLFNKSLSVAMIIGVWSTGAGSFPECSFAKQMIFGRPVAPAVQGDSAEAGALLKTDPELEDVLEKGLGH